MAGKRVMVSGAGGFIGRWSVPALLDSGYEVHAITGPTERPAPAQLRGAETLRLDLLDPVAVAAWMSAVKPTHLLHFAWIATPGVYWSSPENARWQAASEQLLRCFHANGGIRAVMAGTCAEYDWARVGVCHEISSPLADPTAAGITPYAAAKLAVHADLQRFAAAHALSAAWGRVFFQFGPGEHPDRLVASVIRSLLAGREAPCSHGRQVRSFLHVADVGAAFAALIDSPVEGAVNIGAGESLAVAQLLHEIGRQIGRPELIKLGARSAPVMEPALLVPDVHRLQTDVGWRPRFSLNDGIADTIAWWRDRCFA